MTDIDLIKTSELMGNSNFRIGTAYLKNGIRIDKFGIEVCYKKLNPQINLTFNFLVQKYFFHDNPTWNINYSEQVFQADTCNRYLEYLLMVKKEQVKNGIDKSDAEFELTPCLVDNCECIYI